MIVEVTNKFLYNSKNPFLIKNITGLSLSDSITLKINDVHVYTARDISVSQIGIMKGKVEITFQSTNNKHIYYTIFPENEQNYFIIPYLYLWYSTLSGGSFGDIKDVRIVSHFHREACFVGFTTDPELLIISGEMKTEELRNIITIHNIKRIRIYGFTKLLSYIKNTPSLGIDVNYIN